MNLNKYSVKELDYNESKLVEGGTWLSYWLGFVAESCAILGERGNRTLLSAEGQAVSQALRDFQ